MSKSAADLPASPTLAGWATLRVSGDDAEAFLQGQISADVRRADSDGVWTSYNSPKGRMLAVLRLARVDGRFELRLPATLAEPIARRLRMFVLRSKVQIEVQAPADPAAEPADRRALIEAGVPVVYAETQDRWVAQMANLDWLGGISFEKGCYTGQEVVARLHYLGNLKKRMFLVRGAGVAPAPGTAIHDASGDGQAVGDIVDACADGAGFLASAVLQLAAADKDTLALARDADPGLARPQPYAYG